MSQFTTMFLAVGVILLAVGIPSSDGWNSCSIDRRIELSAEGHAPDEIERLCREAAFATDLQHPPSDPAADGSDQGSLSQLEARAGIGRDNGSSASRNDARLCQTSYGVCPSAGESPGQTCHCPGWNGYLFTGVAR